MFVSLKNKSTEDNVCIAAYSTISGVLIYSAAAPWCVRVALLFYSQEMKWQAQRRPPTRQKALSVCTSLLIYRFVAENGTFVPGMQRRSRQDCRVCQSHVLLCTQGWGVFYLPEFISRLAYYFSILGRWWIMRSCCYYDRLLPRKPAHTVWL